MSRPLPVPTKVLVITGAPRVGKKRLLNSILKILSVRGVRIALAAPTGPAAKRLSERTGLEAKTIHRLLEADPMHGGFRRNGEHALEGDLLEIDETSIIDVPLMHTLLKAGRDHAALILIGDVDQLAPVGPGQAVGDIIASRAIRPRVTDRSVPAGGREPDHRGRPSHQPRSDAGMSAGPDE